MLRVKDLTFDKFEPSWCGGWTRLARWLGAWPSRALNNKNWNRNHWLLVIQVLRSKCVLPFKLLKKANLANLSLGGRVAGGLAEAPNNKNWNSYKCLLAIQVWPTTFCLKPYHLCFQLSMTFVSVLPCTIYVSVSQIVS